MLQRFVDDHIMDVRRDGRSAGALEDGPELEIITVTGGKRYAIEVCHLVESGSYSLGQLTRPGIFQRRRISGARCSTTAPGVSSTEHDSQIEQGDVAIAQAAVCLAGAQTCPGSRWPGSGAPLVRGRSSSQLPAFRCQHTQRWSTIPDVRGSARRGRRR